MVRSLLALVIGVWLLLVVHGRLELPLVAQIQSLVVADLALDVEVASGSILVLHSVVELLVWSEASGRILHILAVVGPHGVHGWWSRRSTHLEVILRRQLRRHIELHASILNWPCRYLLRVLHHALKQLLQNIVVAHWICEVRVRERNLEWLVHRCLDATGR